MSFGSKLRALREQRGMSARQLARSSGLAFSHVQHLERDESIPGDETLRRLARALGIQLRELKGERKASQVTALLQERTPLTEEQRQDLLRVVQDTLGDLDS